MRRRLTLVLVSLVAGALLVAGAGALVAAREGARAVAVRQLRRQGEVLAAAAADADSMAIVSQLGRMLRLEDSMVVRISPSGALLTPLPPGAGGLAGDVTKLAEDETVSGWHGNLAYAGVPVRFTHGFEIPSGDSYAIVLTRQVPNLVPGWYWLLLIGAATLLLTVAVAMTLSRRLSRPIVEASVATSRIAGGELDTRLPDGSHGIPELDLLAASINAMAARLGDAREHERRLLLSVSHDLRTPLTSIRGYAEAIEEGIVDDAASAAGVIVAESRRLERLVGDLLELAKLEARQLSLHPRVVPIARAVIAVVNGLRPLAEFRHVDLSFAEEPQGLAIFADEDRLVQVLTNITENAVDFASSRVLITAGVAGGRLVLSVTDDGPGIPPHELEKVFDRFYQGDRGRPHRTGSGLGLAIVVELVAAMNGTVWAESPVDGVPGSRFVVEFPRPSRTVADPTFGELARR